MSAGKQVTALHTVALPFTRGILGPMRASMSFACASGAEERLGQILGLDLPH